VDNTLDLDGDTARRVNRALIEALSDMNHGVVVVEGGRALYASDAFCAMCGYSPDDLLAMESVVELVVPDQRALLRDRMVRRLAGEPVLSHYETTMLHRDGRHVPVEVSARAWTRESGGPVSLIIVRDVTARDETDRALRASELRFRRLVDDADDVIFTIDSDGYFTFVNATASRLMGFSDGELIGRHFLELIRSDYRDDALAFYERQLASRMPTTSFEFPAMTREGREIWFNQKVQLITDGDRIVTIQAIARDITEQRRLETQLRQAQKMEAVGRLAGGVAHDFNNLMTIVLGCVDLAESSVCDEATVLGELVQIREAALRASALTQQLLGFSRRQMARPRPLSVLPLLVSLEGMLRRLIGEDIAIRFVDDGHAGAVVRADPAQLEQVVLNLVVNARDAMPDGGELRLAVECVMLDEAYCRTHPGARPGEYVRLEVSDTGTGMSDDVRTRVFEPFFTTKAPGSGSGLGLSTVYGIVKQNEGYISIESSPGEGTTVHVLLPRLAIDAPTTEAQPIAPPVPMRGSETILVVEDEARVAALARRTLERAGYRVIVESSGEDALRAVEAGQPFDLVVSDLILSGMDGVELSRRMTTLRPGLRMLLVSGYHDRSVDLERTGIPFLAKPYRPADLCTKVRTVLDSPDPVPATD
jgi:PAS domain S-box-containing protein